MKPYGFWLALFCVVMSLLFFLLLRVCSVMVFSAFEELADIDSELSDQSKVKRLLKIPLLDTQTPESEEQLFEPRLWRGLLGLGLPPSGVKLYQIDPLSRSKNYHATKECLASEPILFRRFRSRLSPSSAKFFEVAKYHHCQWFTLFFNFSVQ